MIWQDLNMPLMQEICSIVATIYAGLEVNEPERETFYNHMGHSESVNKNISQSPQTRQTITRVGRFLHDIDQGVKYIFIIK